ncbi:hypothetical protein H9657_18200 [Cellulomonas sp. Sa3CUA2]|uniref:AlgX/AlgJ SGNH hydrolase-like domain-containing protein n=1 Tax=Cellulomonas avistercoris TaxID=2762242 RepID=A0ABR8QIG0_9CELL|nr:hypothetical protein [Cellulomonas avistercoris]MBD7920208.1 hypothetical protein [Cellulomonas avistercoris]
MKRIHFTPAAGRKLTVGVFMAALVAPVVAVGASDHVRETISVLVNDPASWQAQSNRLRAGTPLWNNSVAAYSTLLYRLDTSSNEAVGVVGRDGWMFLGDVQNLNFSQAIGRKVLTPGEADAWADVVAQQQTWLETRGIPMVFAVGPAKWSVYPDRLPAWTDDVRGPTSFDAVLEARPDLGLVDLRGVLRDAEDPTYSPLNSHWTDYGAYVGWTGLAEVLEDRVDGLDPAVPGLEGIETVDDGPNEFDAMMGVRAPNPWTNPLLDEDLPDYAVVQPDGSTVPMGGEAPTSLLDLPRTTTSTAAGNDLTALVLRDSMGDALTPYLQASFGRTVQVRHNIDNHGEAPNLQALVDLVQPDVVIFEMAERHFNSGLPDAATWHAANAYDDADASLQLDWSADAATPGAVAVDGELDAEGAEVTWQPSGTAGQVLRVSLLAGGPGQLEVVSDDGTVTPLRVARDANVLFAHLPAGASQVTLRPVDGSAAATLTSVSVRPAS